MSILNDYYNLALSDIRKRNLISEEVTVESVNEESTFDTGNPYYVIGIRELGTVLLFPVTHQTRKIGDLKAGDRIVLNRCVSKRSVIAGIRYKNGETIFSSEDPANQYV